MDTFLNMGGYGRYVWPSYALAAAVLLWNIWSAVRLQRQALEHARRRAAIAKGDADRRAA
jgi:heme exporter protein CcmD